MSQVTEPAGGQVSILDRHGFPMAKGETATKAAASDSLYVNDVNRWWQTLSNTRLPAPIKAEDPLSHHAWIFAAAFATSTTASTPPFTVFRETPETVEDRRMRAKRVGRPWLGAPTGERRMAVRRWMERPPLARQNLCRSVRSGRFKGLEEDLDHPVSVLLERPNPFQVGRQLWQMTHLWMDIRGEAFWVLTGDDGSVLPVNSVPSQVWPIPPDCFKPMWQRGTGGSLVGWWYYPPRWLPQWRGPGHRMPLRLDEVIQFKLPNPHDPVRGMSRLRSIALNIETDLQMDETVRSTIENDSTPRGILQSDHPVSVERQNEFIERWESTHKGDANRGRMAMLTDGFKFQQISLSPVELQFLERMRWNREAVLAVMDTPPSVLGITEFTNYATALVQDRRFWNGKIIPLLRLEEDSVDRLFFLDGDDVFGMFDLGDVEALRAGHAEKITMANSLSGDKLHAPPRVAYEVVGLDVEEYEGDDTALVSGISIPVRDVLDGSAQDFGPAPPDSGDGADPDPEADDDAGGSDLPDSDPGPSQEDDEDFEVPVAAGARIASKRWRTRRKQQNLRRWRQYVIVQGAMQRTFRRAYRGWVQGERAATLRRFDEITGIKARRIKQDEIDLTLILPEPGESGNALRLRTRPTYTAGLETIYDFTSDDLGGIPVFEVDDQRIQQFFERRQALLSQKVPGTLIGNLSDTLTAGIQNGETIQALRVRIGQVFDIAASSGKALTIARTETASFMSGARDEMFGLQGIEESDWSDAGDEFVRKDHVTFGNSGPHPRGFDYLQLVDGAELGRLRYPGDLEGPPGQTINCRCLEMPIVE